MLAPYKKCLFDFLFKSLDFLRQKTILGQSIPYIAPFGAIIYIYIYIYIVYIYIYIVYIYIYQIG